MPQINVRILENVFTPEQKQEMIEKFTDAMVSIEGEALRSLTWVIIDEIKEGTLGIGGRNIRASEVHRMQKQKVAA